MHHRRPQSILVSLGALALLMNMTACTGEVGLSDNNPQDGDDMSASDMMDAPDESGSLTDMSGMFDPDFTITPPRDQGVLAPDMPVSGPDDMAPDMAAPPRDQGMPPDMAPVDPCASVSCGTQALCRAGTCVCPPGFEGDPASACSPISPGDTALRTKAEVCGRWQQDFATRATSMWQTEPTSQCDLGQISQDALDDAARRTSLYRWLVGLDPVTLDANINQTNQYCATTLAAIGRITHSIPMSAPCYTSEASQGAGSSNLSQGTRDIAASVDLYIGDRGVDSLGHRRWVFNPSMGKTGFGFRGNISCMYSFDRSNSSAKPDYVAYPPPGIIPQAAMKGVWSFASSVYSFSGSTQIEINEVQGAGSLSVSNIYIPSGNYGGMPSLAWSVADIQPDIEYEVTLKDLQRGNVTEDVTYRVTLTTCN